MEYNDGFQFCNSYILPDEHITWKGQPEKGNYLAPHDIFMIPFSLFWCGFALFWELTAIQSGVGFMMFWGLPFVAVGLYMVLGRFLYAAYMRDKTYYIVTNKKLIIKKGSHITIYDGKDLPPMTLRIHKNGNGTITFSETTYYRRGRYRTHYFGLENIRNPIHAQNAISAMEK